MRNLNQLGVSVLAAFIFIGLTGSARGMDDVKPGAIVPQSYYAGNGLLQRGMYEGAVDEYRAFLREHADHEKAPVARYGLAVSLVRLKRFAEAVPELEVVRKQPAFEFAAEAMYMLGQCRDDAGQREEALGEYRDLLKRHGGHALAVDAAARAADILYQLGRMEEAAAACNEYLSKWPSAPQRERLLLVAGMAEAARGNTGKAAGHFEALLGAFAKGACAPQAVVGLARCRRTEGKVDEAVKLFRQALVAPSDVQMPDAFLGLGEALLEKGDFAEAGKTLDELIAKHGDGPLVGVALIHRGRVWLAASAPDRALEAFAKAGEWSAELADDVAYWSAKCEVRQERFKEAAKRLRKAIQASPQGRLAVEMSYDRAIALLKSGERDKAVDELNAFVARHEKHAMAADAMELLATTLHESGRYAESSKSCETFLEQFASHARAATVAFVLAENAFMQKEYGPASAAFRRFVEGYAKDARVNLAKCRLGLALSLGVNAEEAVSWLSESASGAETDIRLVPAVMALGGIQFDRGEWKQAEATYQRYLQLAKDEVGADEALLKIGLSQARQAKPEDALRSMDQLIAKHETSPHRVQAVFERGQILMTLKRPDEAVKSFESVLSLAPDSRFAPFAKKHLGTLSLQRGDYEQAEKLLADAAGNEKGGDVALDAMFQRGLALLAAADYPAAEKALRKFLRQGETHASVDVARVQLVVALARQGRHDDALEEAARVKRETLTDPARASLDYEQAWCLRETGKEDAAAGLYRRLVEDTGAGELQLHAMMELAAIESAAKRPEVALALLEKLQTALKGRTGEPNKVLSEQAAYRVGLAQFELSRFADAAGSLSEFITTYPSSDSLASACFYAAEAFFRVNKFEQAGKHFEQALAVGDAKQTWRSSALLRWGDCLGRLEQWAKSEDTLNRYLKEYGDSESWYQATFGVGWARENLGRHEEAVSAYLSVVEKHKGPTAARAQFQIGECLFAMKKYEAAVRELMKVDILYDYPEWSAAAIYEAGRCLEKLSKTAEARKQFEAVVEKYSGTNWAGLATKRLGELSRVAMPGHSQN